MSAALYIVLFASVFLAGASVLYVKVFRKEVLKLLLAFSGAYLFSLTVLHLIPEVYAFHDFRAGWFILAGFFFQLLMETFSEGIEHGHVHVHAHPTATFPLALMIGLCIHSFLEGMPLMARLDHESFYPLLGGIILHHIPVAMALAGMLAASGLRRGTTLTLLLIFSLMAPAGSLFSHVLGTVAGDLSVYYYRVMAVVIGIFLHISTTILFESSEEHRFNYLRLGIILAGAAAAMMI
jgi:zinc and cadmium transporter